MKNKYIILLMIALLSACAAEKKTEIINTTPTSAEDPYVWLEDVGGERQLDWVRQRNEKSLNYIKAHPKFDELHQTNQTIYNSNERIPYVSQMGDHVYNFWRDDKNIRGVYRRTTLADYQNDSPAWETVLDIDTLAKTEDENWVYKGMNCRYPAYDRCLVNLSRGGADATVVREFDLDTKAFVKDGFYLPEAKSGLSWFDKNTLYVGTDFGPDSLTDSGYPRIVKAWKRGTPLTAATQLYAGEKTDVGVWPAISYDGDTRYPAIVRSTTFYTRSNLAVGADNSITAIEVPEDASVYGVYKGQLLVELKSDWTVGGKKYPQGAVLSTDYQDFMNGKRDFETLVEPNAAKSFQSLSVSKDYVYITMLEDVISKLYQLQWNGSTWSQKAIELPGIGTVSISGTSSDNNQMFINFTSFLEPSTLYLYDGDQGDMKAVKNLPAFFDASKYQVAQHFTTSQDGTKIPYFLIQNKGVKNNGKNPTLIFGYGGFEVSIRPSYSATVGTNWLDQGGTYVVANIRGGGEYGPAWHQAVLKEKRPLAYQDFIAVAEDLIDRKITSPKHLGIRGGSNGGLLVGAVFTMRPDLFNAVVCQVPLLDMQRYHKLLAGASWMAEYGNPDVPEEWAYIKKYSPYHNVFEDKDYPKVFFTTSTRDDRVHPAHARKMVAKMEAQGHDILYYENIEGGHGGAANNNQAAYLNALIYSYLMERLQ
ncbi:prolyl oligopeptidase family protein [Marinicella sp. W31]|uniref:prolyl oligopeptidase family serine peptidase n=1 Tax=Marinicella sp. W31 TaxID=3023713 RepID=UPI003757E5FC